MKTHSEIQGTPAWLALRAEFNTASEASAMKGESKYQSRDELLSAKKYGVTKEITPHTQKLFDKGHAAEASIRPVIEKLIGKDLYPVTGSVEIDGVKLLASFDGLTMLEDINFEHKLWNEELAQSVRDNNLHPHYTWQFEQQMLVSGAEKTIFVVSDGTEENMVYCWYEPVPGKADELIEGWKQFEIDLASHEHVAKTVKPVAETVESLPSVSIQFDGGISVIDNLAVFGEALTEYVDQINNSPETDQDFANLESAVKVLKKAEEALDAAENGALSQAESIDVMRRTVAMYRELARSNRLTIDKLVKSKKDQIKADIVKAGNDALVEHQKSLNESLGGNYIQWIEAGFELAVKGKRTIDSIRGAVNDAIAAAKIKSNAEAELIRANLKVIDANEEYRFLFNDLGQIVRKELDDFKLVVESRINEHKQREADKEAERKADEAKKQEVESKPAQQTISEENKDFVAQLEDDPAEESNEKPLTKAQIKKREADIKKIKKYVAKLNEIPVPKLNDAQCTGICSKIVEQLMAYQDRLDELFPESEK